MNRVNDSKSESTEGPLWYEHELLMDGDRAAILTNLTLPPHDGRFAQCPHLAIFRTALKVSQEDILSAANTVSGSPSSFEFVGYCATPSARDWCLYVDGELANRLDSDVPMEVFDTIDDCFLTRGDEGEFHRSFLLPSEFRDVGVEIERMLAELKSEGVEADRLFRFVHVLALPEARLLKNCCSLFGELGFQVDLCANGEVQLFESGTLNPVDRIRNAAKVFKIVGAMGGSYSSWEVDLRDWERKRGQEPF